MKDIVSYLRETFSCCYSCCLRFCNYHDLALYRDSKKFCLRLLGDNICNPSSFSDETCNEDVKVDSESVYKDDVICFICFGLLQKPCLSDAFLEKVVAGVRSKHQQFSGFCLSISLPLTTILHERIVVAYLRQKFGNTPLAFQFNYTLCVKDIWKSFCIAQLEEKLGVSSVHKSNNLPSEFEITLDFEHESTQVKLEVLKSLKPEEFQKRKNNRFRFQMFTRTSLYDLLQDFSDDDIRKHFPISSRLTEPLVLTNVICCHPHMFVAGRYNKFSRVLSQTPWLIDGVRKHETSVEEIICLPVKNAAQADSYTFVASGREDVDVRMLGTGRPFVIELVNPKVVALTTKDFVDLEETINVSTPELAKVNLLNYCSKSDLSMLKDGEEQKTKYYVALCWCKDARTQQQLDDAFGNVKDLEISQWTPIRVLHRRCVAARTKVIHSTSTRSLTPHSFLLFIAAQAGTYIKEFCHGDFGRTRPDVSTLLDTECDIEQLDVEHVDLQWPPSEKS